MTTPDDQRRATFALAAAEHAEYVVEAAQRAADGARHHRDQLAERHARELAAAEQQIAELDEQLDAAHAELDDRRAAADLVPAELGGPAGSPTTEAAARVAAADGGAT